MTDHGSPINRSVLVTGASGNVGREVVWHCRAQGLMVREGMRLAPNVVASSARVHFDFLDRKSWEPALKGCAGLFLLRPPALRDMKTTLNPLVDAAYGIGIEHIVFLSVMGADRMSWVPHHAVEAHLQASRKPWTILRPGFFAQNLQDAYRQDIIEDDRIYVPARDGRVAFLDVSDVGAICARMFSSPNAFAQQAYTLTGPEAHSFADVANLLGKYLGRAIDYVPASIAGYVWHLRRKRSLPFMQAAVQAFLHVGLRNGDAEAVTDGVPRLLGRPASTLEAYIARSVSRWDLSANDTE